MRLLASTAFAAALVISPSLHAENDVTSNNDVIFETEALAPPPPNRPYPNRCQAGNRRVNLQRWVRNQNLQLRQILNIGQECNGMIVSRVRIQASGQNYSGAQATLYVNGRPASYAQNIRDTRRQAYDFYLNRGQDELGRDIQTLQLGVRGQVYIETIVLQLDNNRYGPGPGPGPRPGPGPGPRPGPGPYPNPQPGYYPVWSISAQGGYYDTTGRIQGAYRLPQMRQYGGTLAHSGEPVPQVPVLVNSMGHICNTPATAPGLGNCTNVPTHYE